MDFQIAPHWPALLFLLYVALAVLALTGCTWSALRAQRHWFGTLALALVAALALALALVLHTPQWDDNGVPQAPNSWEETLVWALFVAAFLQVPIVPLALAAHAIWRRFAKRRGKGMTQ